jgi:2-dehydro-3-deoxygluconokinase
MDPAANRLGLYFVEPGADLRTMRVVYDRAGSAFAQIDPGDIDWTQVLAARAGSTRLESRWPSETEPRRRSLVRSRARAARAVSLDLNYREAGRLAVTHVNRLSVVRAPGRGL